MGGIRGVWRGAEGNSKGCRVQKADMAPGREDEGQKEAFAHSEVPLTHRVESRLRVPSPGVVGVSLLLSLPAFLPERGPGLLRNERGERERAGCDNTRTRGVQG